MILSENEVAWRPSSAKPGVLVKVIVRVTRPENGDATIPRSVGRFWAASDQGRAFGPGLAATVKRRKFQTRQDGRGCRVDQRSLRRAADCSESPYLLGMNELGFGRFRLSIAGPPRATGKLERS